MKYGIHKSLQHASAVCHFPTFCPLTFSRFNVFLYGLKTVRGHSLRGHTTVQCTKGQILYFIHICQSFSSESESAEVLVLVRKFRSLKTLRTRTQRVCLFTHLYCKEFNISQKIPKFFLKILLFLL
jgi:hypothetical protein